MGDYERYLKSITPSGQELPPGIEYTTVRSRFGHHLNKRAEHPGPRHHAASVGEEQLIARLVRSLHASFRDEAPNGGFIRHLFPHTDDSLRQMASVQKLAGRPLRAVLYTRHHHNQAADYRPQDGLFRARSFQPKPKDFDDLWHLPPTASAGDVKLLMDQHGLDDVTPDTVHSKSLGPIVQRLAAAGLVKAIHVSVGRTDLPPEMAKQSERAKQAFMTSPEAAASTPEGDMLLGVFRHWRKQGGDYLATLETSPGLDPRRSRREQQAMLETTHGLLEMANLKTAVN
jgi:hypothetical protein